MRVISGELARPRRARLSAAVRAMEVRVEDMSLGRHAAAYLSRLREAGWQRRLHLDGDPPQ